MDINLNELLALTKYDQRKLLERSGTMVIDYSQGESEVKVYKLNHLLFKVTISNGLLDSINEIEDLTLFQAR